jgi:hypothetical protein
MRTDPYFSKTRHFPRGETMSIGPVEFLVVKFPGSHFHGKIAPALQELVDSGTVRVLDLAFITKADDGTMAAFEIDNLDSEVIQAFEAVSGSISGLLSDQDFMVAGEALDPGDSAALLVWEDLWAARFAAALRDADAELIDIQRIPREVVVAAIDYAEAGGD